MAINRAWQCGFETGSTAELDGGAVYSSGPVRTGTKNNRLLVSGAAAERYVWKNVPATRQIRTAYANYKDFLGDSGQFLVVRDASTNLIEIRLASTDELALYVGGVQKDITTNSPHAASAWFHMGIDCKIDSSAGWASVYLNGLEILSFTGTTGNSDIESVRFGSPDYAMGGSSYFYIDDLYIDDTTGEGSADICPILGFGWIYPNGDGNYSQWTGSDGNQVNNYLMVDTADSDYVEADSADQFDSYAMTTVTAGEGEVINAVIPTVLAQRYGAAEEIAVGLRYSSTNVVGSDQDPGFGAWSVFWDRQVAKPGGGAWDQTAVDGVEVVIYSTGTFS